MTARGDVAKEFKMLRLLVDAFEASSGERNNDITLKKIRKAAAALTVVERGRPRREPTLEWADLIVIANRDLFGGSIRKTIEAHCEAGILPRTSTEEAHRVRIESRIKEIKAAAKSNVVALRKKK